MASHSNQDDYEITGINVTPLVDIMMVLLIIFLVTATYIVKEAIRIELPRAATSSETTGQTLKFLIDKNGAIFLDGAPADDKAIVRRIESAPQKRDDLQALVAADRDARHGAVVHLLDLLKSEGVTKFAIEVEREHAAVPAAAP